MIAILYFPAGNDVSITSMIFASLEAGRDEVERITGQTMTWNEKRKEYWIDLDDFINDEEGIHAKKFFTSYDAGCGEAERAILKEVEYGKPLFAFNLD